MKRWLVLALGLGIGLAAIYAVLTAWPTPTPLRAPVADAISEQEVSNAGSVTPVGEIREPSRARLRQILRQDEQEEEESSQ